MVQRRVDICLQRQHVGGRQLFPRIQHAVDASRAPGRIPHGANGVRVFVGNDAAIGSRKDPTWRVEHAGKFLKRNVAGPFVGVVLAAHGQAAVAVGADGVKSRGLVPDVPVNVGIHHVLARRVQERRSVAEFLPVLRGVQVEERVGEGIVERPAQSQLARAHRRSSQLIGNEVRDDGAVAGDGDVQDHVPSVLHVNDFGAVFGLEPTVRSLVFAVLVEILDVQILHGRLDVGEAPGNALVVTDDDERHSGQRHADYIVTTAAQMRLIPKVRHLVAKVHVIREQRLPGNRMRAGDSPVIGTGHESVGVREGVGYRLRIAHVFFVVWVVGGASNGSGLARHLRRWRVIVA